MTTSINESKPLKTWSYLSTQRRRPSEYEIVSTGLHFSTDNPDCPWELSPDLGMNKWFRKYREGSALKHVYWDGFRDPDELIYRTYNIIQDGQENYVEGLIQEFDGLDHDQGLTPDWVDTLTRLYTPARYLLHGLQIGSAYLSQLAPASTITNCSTFQAADSLRWLSHLAYRTKQLQLVWPDYGFCTGEREAWEKDPCWQGFRELLEKTLVTYDWGEAFVALNLVLKPAIDEAVLRQLSFSARRNGDTLLGFLIDAQIIDTERSRRWTSALTQYALENESNQDVLDAWVSKWVPLGDQAIDVYCEALSEVPTAADDAKRDAWAFRAGLGVSV